MQTPPLEPGLTLVDQPDRGAIQRLVLEGDVDGEVLWVDVHGTASTYTMTEMAPNRRALRGIHIARAFQAYNHFELIQRLVRKAGGKTGLIVVPNLAMLYEHADQPQVEIRPLFERTVATLAELANTLVVPVLVTAPHAGPEYRSTIEDATENEIGVERTGLGYAYSTDDWETDGYWHEGWWQTTVPYWVELLGAVEEWDDPTEVMAPQLTLNAEPISSSTP